jgi:uncharacterized Zn-finger protein
MMASARTAAPDSVSKDHTMAASLVPHLCNDQGVAKIAIGVKEFQCMGAKPPFDHPHVYLDMGGDDETICPYCSTHYVYDPQCPADVTMPPGCLYDAAKKAA